MSGFSLKLPDALVIDESSYSNTFGRFSLKPLERGFGVTLGNSLRRVLLSSLPGSAITAVKFSGLLHEFTTIDGVVEDVSEIILNLKQVRLKLLSKKPEKIKLSLKGPGEWTAADIQKFSNEIEILNPTQHIATLNKNAKFEVEIRVGHGYGYVPANENFQPDQPIGVIPIDSIFSPIKNVQYQVSNVRIGDKNDYENLVIEISTDGSITPDDALAEAAKLLSDHLQYFYNYNVADTVMKPDAHKDPEIERIRRILLTKVDDLELSVRAHNCLKAANILTIADLVKREEQELLRFRNFGRKSLAELGELIESLGLEFGMDVNKYLNENIGNN